MSDILRSSHDSLGAAETQLNVYRRLKHELELCKNQGYTTSQLRERAVAFIATLPAERRNDLVREPDHSDVNNDEFSGIVKGALDSIKEDFAPDKAVDSMRVIEREKSTRFGLKHDLSEIDKKLHRRQYTEVLQLFHNLFITQGGREMVEHLVSADYIHHGVVNRYIAELDGTDFAFRNDVSSGEREFLIDLLNATYNRQSIPIQDPNDSGLLADPEVDTFLKK
jgi:hypothetical protein